MLLIRHLNTSWSRAILALPTLFYLLCSSMRSDRTVTVAKKGFARNSATIRMLENPDIVIRKVNATYADETDETGPALPRVTWNAAVKSSVRVKEGKRTCEEYMRLPASEYSVLTADQIVRLSETEFKCTLPAMNFFGMKIQPVLYVNVNVYPELNRSEIVVLRAETIGSETAERVNGTFSLSAINVVSAGIAMIVFIVWNQGREGFDKKGRKTLNSDTKLVVNVEVPPSRIPRRVVQGGGNFIIQASLDIIVPTFVRVLSADFQRWSDGNDTRDALEETAF